MEAFFSYLWNLYPILTTLGAFLIGTFIALVISETVAWRSRALTIIVGLLTAMLWVLLNK